MARYDMTYFMTLPLKIGYKLIQTAYLETEKQKAWELWLARRSTEPFQPFSKFFESNKTESPNKGKRKSMEQMLKEANDISGKIDEGKYKEVKM